MKTERDVIPKDYDTWECEMYGLPYPIYFYFLSYDSLPSHASDSSQVMGNCPSILSIQLVPFLGLPDVELYSIPYDSARFGSVDPTRPALQNYPDVFRVRYINNDGKIRLLKTFNTYPASGKNTGPNKDRYWKNESRLLNYPYSFGTISDNLNPPFTFKYHLCKDYVKSNLRVRNTISDRCSYGLYIEGYKGDNSGVTEAMVSGDSHELPCSSSAYNQWYASNKNQNSASVKAVSSAAFLQTQQSNQMLSSQQKLAESGASFGISSLGSIFSTLQSRKGVNATQQINRLNNKFAQQQAQLDVSQAIAGTLAQTNDLRTTPNTMVSMGSDLIYGISKGASSVTLHRYSLTTEYAVRIADYFAMYGYKQNKLMKPNIRNRYFYNYIKTVGCNFGTDSAIPKDALETLKGIFDRGLTIWHITRPGVVVSDYSKDNYEY